MECTLQMGNIAFCANQKGFWEIGHTAFELKLCGLLDFYTAVISDSSRKLLETMMRWGILFVKLAN